MARKLPLVCGILFYHCCSESYGRTKKEEIIMLANVGSHGKRSCWYSGRSLRSADSLNLFIVKHNLLPVNTTIILIIIVLVLIHN